ncbi:MAG TPA: AAA-associated domain-containing protein, partial [Streptosporangiaceae bacterium]
FARACLDRAPLVRTIYRALRGSLDGTLPAGFFTDILRTSFGEEDSARQLDVAINWGRYAELYAFDAGRDQVMREEQGIGATLADRAEPARRGALTLYLGAAPGSGKTFTMLREGRALRSQGEDVVIGAVRTHGRPRTTEAIGGLEAVPPLHGPPGAKPGEMDTAAVLARRPGIALVDDLGLNEAGIAALRAAGIDVISTADVADVQRVAGAVADITGRPPAATVTDQMLADADEVQFVDSSPEALRKRLGHGNIYPGGQAPPELAGTFETESLAALRELGLRLVADTLPAPAQARAREPQDVLVAVTGQDRSVELVRHGIRLARRGGARCSVLLLGASRGPATPVGAVTQGASAARQEQQRAGIVAEVRRAAADADAEVLERDGDAATVIPQGVRQSGARHLVIAAQPPGVLDRLRDSVLGRLRGSAAERLLAQLPDVHLHVLPPADPAPDPAPKPPPAPAGATIPADVAPAGAGPEGEPVPGSRPARRGAIRVYLGYARGCGTTTAMLEEAVRRKARGADVIVAAVAGRDREGVHGLLDELGSAGGSAGYGDGSAAGGADDSADSSAQSDGSGDLDVAGVLARRPEVACVDDITAASRLTAARRLADAGITVIATAHLGGDLDEASLLALADEVELVDVAPPALIDRVRRGEIVPADQVPQALAGEYAPDALTERREQAFRIVAEHADRRLAAYRRGALGSGALDRPAILACVAPVPGMEPLIRRCAALAAQVDGEFQAAMVLPEEADGQIAGYAALVTRLGGELAVLAGADPAAELAAWARAHGTTEMVLARGGDGGRAGRYPVLRELAARPANLELHVLPAATANP